ncbi:peptide chain release factor N(5)-glutamine methyltransferase [Gulosibacter sp. 10]|uniref:peptide chain release factor N(5)-glutamine methyltransferase n=1 Tax=Gulosibacter sp. 10 TaxID=1255570 RepID=UPI00097F5A01|nr:peptide chain release factor N(5)-glutamine methyltransferase [Gulosibacter sp. 10]SJM57680.1 Protein-N(5)-glutamine methyltransferase PrmC, methylates polypeptide chain release factors RF1 and RF2 [Gulosibacter sp. 10]
MDMTQLRMQVRRELADSGLEHPRREADLLMAAISGRSLGDLELDLLMGRGVAAEEANRILRAARRRARRWPLQYLAGEAPCYGLDFRVGPGVFIPRPETEQLIEHAIGFLRRFDPPADGSIVADLGSGSGAIAAAVAVHVPDAEVRAFEASPYAWPWLVDNLRRLAPGVGPVFGDWQERIHADESIRYAAILSNPPYIPTREVPADPEVRLFDPETALYSGADGLGEIRRIADSAARLLAPGGLVAVEHTERQGGAIREILAAAGLVGAATERDLAGRDRFTRATAPE